jgi:hypothetical protein
MVNHQIYGTLRVDDCGIPTHSCHRISHSREINHRRYTREILEDDPTWFKRDFDLFRRLFAPVQDILDVLGSNLELVTVTNRALEQHLNADGEGSVTAVLEG